MRLRALHLGNVRKFAGQRASITGIGDGITVVSEANEFGKSTFFDALHALFFEKYSSSAKPVKSLQPYAKGAVEIAAEIETEAGLFRVEKSFVQRKSARILRLPGEVLIAQDDEAERWILEALGSDKNGPAGLLWVRQGVTGLDGDSRDETLKQLETRRDLLSSVSGEIDAMTGGRRMDRVMRRIGDELKALVTATGKPTGPWRSLIGDIAQREDDLAAIEAKIDKLSAALNARKDAEVALAQLDQPEAAANRKAALAHAVEAFSKAKAYAGRVELAVQDCKLAQIEAQAARKRLDEFLGAIEALTKAQTTAAAAQATMAETSDRSAANQSAVSTARAAKAASNAALSEARTALDAARKQVEARAAKIRADDLKVQLQQIEIVQKNRDKARAIVEVSKATSEWSRQLEDAQNAVAAQAASVAARSVTLSLSYSGEARVIRNGTPLSDVEDVVLAGDTTLSLPGIGTMSLQVPDGGDAAALGLARCEATRDNLLEQGGVTSLSQAREHAARRAKAMQEKETAEAILKTLAPHGTDPLRSAKAAADLAASDAHDEPLPAQDTLEAALTKAQADDAAAQGALDRAESAAASAREAAIHASAAAQNANQMLETARATAGPEENREGTRTNLIRADAQAAEALSVKTAALDVLREKAPDTTTAQAELTRAQETMRAATTQIQALRERIAASSAEIHALSDAGIEETRDTLAGQQDAARAQEARYARKAAALIRLQQALEAERSAARDTYFGPVQKELKPLLAILYDEAGVQFDSDSLLPAGLMRSETEEHLDRLSGGTQEQIAILTRLAFARLFKGQGRHMPIVLDDALVYSDDGRIVKMFTALTRVAQDQQILVFTCRTMAFLSLGGTRPEVTIRDL